MNLKLIESAWIGEFYGPYAVNGDNSQLSEKEQRAYDRWMRSLQSDAPGQPLTVDWTPDTDYKRCELTGLHGTCSWVQIWVPDGAA
jgi:hypothetical protein